MPIFDQGYQHWKGEFAGNGWRWLAITRNGVRTGMKNRFVKLLLIAALGPALGLAGVISLWGLVEQKWPPAVGFLRGMGNLLADPVAYRTTAWTLCFHFFLRVEMFFIMVLVMLVGPSLISQDLRFNALPMYFSRPVRRIDYFAGKLGVIGFFLALVTVGPALVAWVLGLMFSLDFRAILDTFALMVGVVLFGVIVMFSAGLLILALSSLSRNSRYIAAFWAGLCFITWIVSSIMGEINEQSNRREAWMAENKVYQKQNQLQREQNPNNDFNQPQFDNQGRILPQKIDNFPNRKPDPQRIAQAKKELQEAVEESKLRFKEADDNLRHDWRPVISYLGDLERLGFALIGSQRAWEKLDELTPGGKQQRGPDGIDFSYREQSKATTWVPQYPWYWSALVLLALGGASVWILNKRVTTMDRLR